MRFSHFQRCISARRLFSVFLFTALSMIAAPRAHAVIVMGGDNAFHQALKKCFDEFLEAGGTAGDIYKQLNQPSPQAHRVTINPTPGYPSGAAKDGLQNQAQANGPGATPAANGTPGPGSDSTVQWNPNDQNPLPDGTPRDPCVSLLHELQHAADMDKGKLNTSPKPGTTVPANLIPRGGIPVCEVDACTTENELRKKKGLPPRRKCGQRDLP